jgi:hypothetical protein
VAKDLYPTKTRLQLLREIANSQVLTDILNVDEDVILLFPDAPTSWQDRVKVTTRVRELEAAGWIAESAEGEWRLAPGGRAILEAHRE